MTDPAPLLAQLGVTSSQVVAPSYGYSGTFTPRAVMPHWTASAAGSDTASSVVAGRHYHACTSRAGLVCLGGWMVRQGHGGDGRTSPQSLARAGVMTVADLDRWHNDSSMDDTSSGANQDFYGVCLDNDGQGERPSDVQWYAYTASVAVFLHMAGAVGPGWLCDHAASTNRKVDLISMTASLYDAAATMLELLTKGPTAVTNQCVGPPAVHPRGGYAQVTTKGYVYVNGPGAKYHGGAQDEFVIAEAGMTCTGLAWTPSGDGYIIGVSDGNVITRGDAEFHGSAAPDMVP